MMRKVRRYNVSLKAGIAECLATALFVYIGCGKP